ncbi:DUF2300 domain-containing protein [Pseudomonas gingeri]|uniref:DUF2300 domain-containing protein n=1 Tax=Pseudomonas gingeri TaxID=117681 RepID=UPI0015A424F7|nr:DUF2300 domain-containing protein [Pseudomonas gingeri]NWA02882.1 DUF2300 domain-containing protein [Pseudomonas gingeri]NWA17045.1 DUF2300 domain-containing protein [Pseudomonas gingeri]NWA58496.1 DUF2300 domain-containing protein [Pseudomonas gingeri]NWA97890.1 DUF2300 domain-containing protein [Pseudomonas gingeri]NWB06026.1 DUF2300 domain-containing protein [Pseudomonas gingeri]
MTRRLAWLLLCVLPLLATAEEEPVRLAWKGADGYELVQLNRTQVLAREPLPASLQAPLGSLWKLFVYAWLVDTDQQEPAYDCHGQDRDEVYCCTPGGSIARDPALVKSCGLYFEPERLQIDAARWRDYWQARHAPAWLLDLDQLKPQTRVSIAELLETLRTLPAQEQARKLLLDVVLGAADGQAVGVLGARLRVKTWSWLGDNDPQSRQGGFAGWLEDGTPLWVGGRGTSQMVLRHYSDVLGSFLPAPSAAYAGRCVQVELFSRYPLKGVSRADGQAASNGALQGRYRVDFANGNQLDIESAGELFLLQNAGQPQLVARLDREEYVARVLQREAKSEPVEAAKALAVAIRTYLLQNAARNGDCLSIDDSSSRQRVAPRPATADARTIAAWTSDLVLAGSPVTYHSDQPGPDKLSWQQAVEQANAGARYDLILQRAYPRASLSRWDNPVASCEPLPAARDWLLKQRRGWRPRLDQEVGYNELSQFAVCRLSFGRPYVDRERQRIYVRGVLTQQDRLDLTHEYLHLAFEAHPNGQDEDYIEGLARHLLLE